MAASLLGCGSQDPAPDGSGSSGNPPPATTAPAFPDNSGQVEKDDLAYPAGPWGFKQGSTIANYRFFGFANAQVVNESMQSIELAEFYNPHADDASYAPTSPEVDDRLFRPGSPYGAGTPKPKTLLIDVAAVWCGPCNQEAKTELPPRYIKYKPMGGEFLLQHGDGPSQGVPATQKNLYNWTKKYKVDFPATIDPGMSLGALFESNAYPANMIINTRTMVIVEIISGMPDAAFWAKFEKTLAGK